EEVLKSLPEGGLVRVAASDPSIRMNLNSPGDWEIFQEASALAQDAEIGHDEALLSCVEVGLGSLIDALHVPLGGHLLSLNQSFLLSRSALRTRSRSAGLRIST